MTDTAVRSATARIVEFASDLRLDEVPDTVRHECTRSLIDSVGCIIGGGGHAGVAGATATLAELFGPPQASLLGQGTRADPLHAALLNGMAGASYSFFDSYSTAHLHAGVVHAAALLAVAERVTVTGAELLTAYAAGMEVACRLTKAIALPPADADIGWSIGGIVCGMSSALAVGRLLGLDHRQQMWAVGIAGSGAAGTRSEHGSVTAALIYGQAAQTGVRAALLASRGLTGSTDSLETRYGFLRMFSREPNPSALTAGLGAEWEVTGTTFKPYPTDIAVHPGIDAVLRLRAEHDLVSTDIAHIAIRASDLAATFCDRPTPANELEAKFSLQHWVAATAVHGRARIEEGRIDVVTDPEIARLRSVTTITADPGTAFDAAGMTVTLTDGRRLEVTLDHCLGSRHAPMPDADVEAKFVSQAALTIGPERAAELVRALWRVTSVPDAAAIATGGC